jgi:hypothetical protein
MSDFAVIVISLSVIVLCWAVVRINQKIDESTGKPHSMNELDILEPTASKSESVTR